MLVVTGRYTEHCNLDTLTLAVRTECLKLTTSRSIRAISRRVQRHLDGAHDDSTGNNGRGGAGTFRLSDNFIKLIGDDVSHNSLDCSSNFSLLNIGSVRTCSNLLRIGKVTGR